MRSHKETSSGPAPGLRYGLIGCGDIGRLRAAALARTGGRLIATSDQDPRRARALAADHGAAADRHWQTLLARDDVDAVIIATPPLAHAEMAVEALHAGKHVLCEKPLARSPHECRAMVAAAELAGRMLATGFNYRFYPSFERARALLEDGAIGALRHIRSYGGYSAASHGQAWVHDAGVVGGGALHDIGIHLIDLTRLFLGEVEEVKGYASHGVWGFEGCEDDGVAVLRGAGNRIATLHASWTEWGRYRFEIVLVGERGRITATCFPMRLELISSDRVGGKMRRTVERFPGTFVGEHARSYRWVVRRSFERELSAFEAAVRGEPASIATGRDGLRAIEIAFAAAGRAEAAEPARAYGHAGGVPAPRDRPPARPVATSGGTA
jgi:predicted dehydrogenase